MFFGKNKNKKAGFYSRLQSSFEKSNRRGFTLIEIVMGMAIVALLSATMFQVIKVSDTQQGLIMNAQKIKAGLRLAQAYSLAIPQVEADPQHICGFGVYRDSESSVKIYYLYVSDYASTPGACDTATLKHSDDGGVNLDIEEIQTITPDGDHTFSTESFDVFFKTPYGKIISSGSELSGANEKKFEIKNSNTDKTKEIIINSSGKINL